VRRRVVRWVASRPALHDPAVPPKHTTAVRARSPPRCASHGWIRSKPLPRSSARSRQTDGRTWGMNPHVERRWFGLIRRSAFSGVLRSLTMADWTPDAAVLPPEKTGAVRSIEPAGRVSARRVGRPSRSMAPPPGSRRPGRPDHQGLGRGHNFAAPDRHDRVSAARGFLEHQAGAGAPDRPAGRRGGRPTETVPARAGGSAEAAAWRPGRGLDRAANRLWADPLADQARTPGPGLDRGRFGRAAHRRTARAG